MSTVRAAGAPAEPWTVDEGRKAIDRRKAPFWHGGVGDARAQVGTAQGSRWASRARLIAVTGKGGVGKTTVAAALGAALAAMGRKVLVLEVDPRESLHGLFGTEPSDGAYVRAGDRLHLQNLDPARVLAQVVREQVGIGWLARKISGHPAFRQVVSAVPGLEEVAVLGHALRLVRGLEPPPAPEVEVVVLDAPATGHGLALLESPLLVAEAIRTGPFGKMAADLSSFVRDPETTATVVVTAAEELPVSETLELRRELADRLGHEPALLVVNGLYPEATPAGRALQDPDPATRLWLRRRAINEAALARLAGHWPEPRVELPLAALAPGPELVHELAPRLAAALEDR